MISVLTRSSRDALTATAFQRNTSLNSSCASGSLWTRVAKCALLCATVCSSVCAFFTSFAYVSLYLLEYKASRSATRITTNFWTSQRRSARSCRPSLRIGPRTSSQSGLDLHHVRNRAIALSPFVHSYVLIMLVALQTRSTYSLRATSRASTLWTSTRTLRGPMGYYSPMPSSPFFSPPPPRRLRPRHRYCA